MSKGNLRVLARRASSHFLIEAKSLLLVEELVVFAIAG